MKKTKRGIALCMAAVILLVNIMPNTAMAQTKVTTRQTVQISELVTTYNSAGSYLKRKAIIWGINHMDEIVSYVSPFLSKKNKAKLKSAVKDIKMVLKLYYDCKSIVEKKLYNALYKELKKTFGTVSAVGISKLIVKCIKGQNNKTQSGSKYILPNSSRKKLTRADLKGFSKKKLKLARNEIYARHGRKFVTAELRKYFNSKSWYKGTIEPEDFIDSKELNKVERYNTKFILKLEKQ